MKRHRTSGLRLFVLVLFGTIISSLWATGKTNGLQVFLGVEAIFVALALAAWSYTAIHFEGNDIVRTIFFFFNTKRPIFTITRIRFGADVDTFGGRTTYATIQFNDAKQSIIFDFSKADLREIVDRISSIVPNVTDVSLRKNLDAKVAKGWKAILRPGDAFLFTAGALFVLVAILLWLTPRIRYQPDELPSQVGMRGVGEPVGAVLAGERALHKVKMA